MIIISTWPLSKVCMNLDIRFYLINIHRFMCQSEFILKKKKFPVILENKLGVQWERQGWPPSCYTQHYSSCYDSTAAKAGSLFFAEDYASVKGLRKPRACRGNEADAPFMAITTHHERAPSSFTGAGCEEAWSLLVLLEKDERKKATTWQAKEPSSFSRDDEEVSGCSPGSNSIVLN